MSFCSQTKKELSSDIPEKTCCRLSLLMGLLTFSGIYSRERIKFITENKAVAELLLGLLDSCFGIKGNLYLSEKKTASDEDDGDESEDGRRTYISYKITVSERREIAKAQELFPANTASLYRINNLVFDEKCPNCRGMYLRGAFLASGTVSKPESSFHLEISSPYRNLVSDVNALLAELEIPAKTAIRKSNYVIYYKKSEYIFEFLNDIGAFEPAFRFLNEAATRSRKSRVNRAMNCDTANIQKMISAAGEVIEAIEFLEEKGLLDQLPPELITTAKLRTENPEMTLAELAALSSPPISKSGISHRMKRITEFADKYR